MRPLIWLAFICLLLLAPFPVLAAGPSAPNTAPLNYCYEGKLPETRILVVDKSRQRLMILRYEGKLITEYEFPCATGVNFGRKEKEGDERTPVGIYFTTHRYTDRKITIFGDRAIHMNYPNPFDQVEGLKGNGIYIHGTNQKLKPRSSNGCITLKNHDLAVLASLIKEQLTPVVVVEQFSLAGKDERTQACQLLDKLRNLPNARHRAELAPSLAFFGGNNGHQKPPQNLAPRLDGLHAKGSKLKSRTQGLVLLGLGKRWVLLVEQEIMGLAKRPLSVVRHFYLTAAQGAQPSLVMGGWVLPDLATARRMASLTPPLPKPRISGPVPAAAKPAAKKPASAKDEIIQAMNLWLKAWQNKDLKGYMRHYAKDFRYKNMDFRNWRKHKAYLNRVYKVIRVKAKNIKIKVKGNTARVSFLQYYRSDWHRDKGIKHLVLVRRGGRWQIYRETWSQIKPRVGKTGRRQKS